MKKIQVFLPWIMPMMIAIFGVLMYLMEKKGMNLGIILCVAAVGYYFYYATDGHCLVDLRALLSLSWLLGIGLSSLRLSKMHTPWTGSTWFSFFGFYVITILTFEVCRALVKRRQKPDETLTKDIQKQKENIAQRLYKLVFIMTFVSFGCFSLEVLKLRYIPLFAKFTHAYNYFHVTGLHYFTFSSMMVHALTTLYIGYRGFKNITGKEKRNLIIANLFALSIPVLCISKLQFLLIFFLPAFMILRFLKFEKLSDLPWKKIILTFSLVVFIGVVAGVLFTARRNYEPGYLNGIFEMRDENMPMLTQYLYMYTTHNYANFNYLTQSITEYSMGLRQAFPLFALTGLKFLFPDVTRFESYLIKPELSTLTIIYDAYFDFGVIGVVGFSVILGVLLWGVTAFFTCKKEKNPISYLLYCEFAVYMLLSFFDTWFSNPTTWFWFGLTFVMYFFVSYKRKEDRV